MKLELLAHLDLSATSGLVHREGALYAVADDGMELLEPIQPHGSTAS